MEEDLKKLANEVTPREPSPAARELLKEIFPLMEEYFEGEMICTCRAIYYTKPNGQAFVITAREVK